MNEIEKQSKQDNAFNRILRFSTDADITLTADEEKIFQRWNYAHKLYLQKKYTTDQIAEKVKEAYGVSLHTGRNDVYYAQALIAGSIKSNKKYLLHHHAENIMLEIEKCKVDKSLKHLLPNMLREYTRAVLAIPDEINKDNMQSPQILIVVKDGENKPPPKDFNEAVERMKKRVYPTAEDISFEEVNDE